ncbi:MAG: hypothetical protein AAF754_02705 [Pseudomonadota bacterium]
MKTLKLALSVFAISVSSAFAANDAAVGSYKMTWGNGKSGTYTISAISDTAADVTYEYGGKSRTKTLKVKNGKIRGGGWFPTVTLTGAGVGGATHSGNKASVSKN